MMHLILTAAFVTLVAGSPIHSQHANQTITTASISAEEFLKQIDREIAIKMNKLKLAQWKYSSNLTEQNLNEQLRTYTAFANFTKDVGLRISQFPVVGLRNEDLQRQFSMWNFLGSMALPDDAYNEYHRTINLMSSIYSTAKVCDYHNRTKCNLAIEPELTEIFMNNRNPVELEYYWVQWRRVSSKQVKPYYPKYVELTNLVAKTNNFQDAVEYWLNNYEVENFPVYIERLWQEVKPLYLQLHAYVRRRLGEKYGENLVSSNGPMPAHLLGNMWAHTWTNVADFIVPYPDKHYPNITKVMLEQGYNATTIFRVAEDFFVSLNLSAMPDGFWEKSIFEKPKDREIICHASAWDFHDAKDFRIKQCTRINMEDLVTAHHEMGHIQYYLQYKDKPFVYRDGANPAFHEAVGDVIALSASTPTHLKAIGLLQKNQSTNDYEATINQMFLMALDKIAFLPYAYALDKWRWDAFKGKIVPCNYNCKWWNMVEELQGIEPPVPRTEEDFDVASKFHVVANVKYVRYFISYIVQFQFHKALCTAAKQYDPEYPERKPMHQCDIYGNIDAGNLLKSMLQVGCSKPWREVMKLMTGQSHISSSGILEYFQPLMDWLKKENDKHNTTIGWVSKKKRCFNTTKEILL